MITFSTKNWMPITYLQRHGEQLLQLMGCLPSVEQQSDHKKTAGILPAETIRAALSSLDHCCLANLQAQLAKAAAMPVIIPTVSANDELEHPVSLATRAYPLIELLRVARDYQQAVQWEQTGPTRL